MNDQRYAETKERLEKYLTKWHPLLQMGFTELKYEYVRGLCPDDESTCACTNSSWTYRKAHITWYIEKLSTLSDHELEDVVVHELVHVLLAPVTQDQGKEWHEQIEFTTQTIAMLFINVQANKDDKYDGPELKVTVEEVDSYGDKNPKTDAASGSRVKSNRRHRL